ncbi:hypothetical protein GCM10007901_08790 [Dyella acidisoli]|uniref:Uncharacterized protein n=1 Tax=Dyella acidisoli TaxID=1867834 RepID=A0ABQ5XL58_9GAMM|nr:hypothetical protein GCM10007901_08790 [Dyella acidisoli]
MPGTCPIIGRVVKSGKDRRSVLQSLCKPRICRIYAIRCVKLGKRNKSPMHAAATRDNLPRYLDINYLSVSDIAKRSLASPLPSCLHLIGVESQRHDAQSPPLLAGEG